MYLTASSYVNSKLIFPKHKSTAKTASVEQAAFLPHDFAFFSSFPFSVFLQAALKLKSCSLQLWVAFYVL